MLKPYRDEAGSLKYGRVDTKGVTELALCRAFFAYFRHERPEYDGGSLKEAAEVARHAADLRIKENPEDYLHGLGWKAPLYLLTMHYLRR